MASMARWMRFLGYSVNYYIASDGLHFHIRSRQHYFNIATGNGGIRPNAENPYKRVAIEILTEAENLAFYEGIRNE